MREEQRALMEAAAVRRQLERDARAAGDHEQARIWGVCAQAHEDDAAFWGLVDGGAS